MGIQNFIDFIAYIPIAVVAIGFIWIIIYMFICAYGGDSGARDLLIGIIFSCSLMASLIYFNNKSKNTAIETEAVDILNEYYIYEQSINNKLTVK